MGLDTGAGYMSDQGRTDACARTSSLHAFFVEACSDNDRRRVPVNLVREIGGVLIEGGCVPIDMRKVLVGHSPQKKLGSYRRINESYVAAMAETAVSS